MFVPEYSTELQIYINRKYPSVDIFFFIHRVIRNEHLEIVCEILVSFLNGDETRESPNDIIGEKIQSYRNPKSEQTRINLCEPWSNQLNE